MENPGRKRRLSSSVVDKEKRPRRHSTGDRRTAAPSLGSGAISPAVTHAVSEESALDGVLVKWNEIQRLIDPSVLCEIDMSALPPVPIVKGSLTIGTGFPLHRYGVYGAIMDIHQTQNIQIARLLAELIAVARYFPPSVFNLNHRGHEQTVSEKCTSYFPRRPCKYRGHQTVYHFTRFAQILS